MNVKATLAGGLAVTAAIITAATALPQSEQPDYGTLPPAPATVEAQIKSVPTGLIPAITAAEKRVGGIAGSAVVRTDRTPVVIEVITYADGRAQRVSVDGSTGTVVDVIEIPRFPGIPVEGDWIETSTGLKYYDIVQGTGDAPADMEAAVKIHFTGYLVNGEQFGSSRDREPMTLSLAAVPPGLAEGISTMRAGGQRKLIIPGNLAAGMQGMPPNATLIFDVELFQSSDYSTIPANLPGVAVQGEPVKLPSGLMYYDVEMGKGEQPADPATVVRVHYTGWTNDGEKFDSSYDHPGGNPYQTALNQVIKGWTEGVGSMKVGGKRKLIIPSDMAYGAAGRPGIPPRALLVFDVELVEIVNQ